MLKNWKILKFLHTWAKIFFQGFKIFRGGWGFAHPTASIFGGGTKHPMRFLDGSADLLGGVKPNFEFLGGSAHPSAPPWPLMDFDQFSINFQLALNQVGIKFESFLNQVEVKLKSILNQF